MLLTPSDISRLQEIALFHVAEQMGLSSAEVKLSIKFDTLAIEVLQLWVVDFLQENKQILCWRAYLALGARHLDIYCLDDFILGFEVEFGIDTHEAPMVATLENAPSTQIELIADVQQESEELCTINSLVHQISLRTGMSAESISTTINLLKFKRFNHGGQTLISTKSIDSIMSRWTQAIAGDVAAALHEESTRPTPLPVIATKTPAKPPAKPKTGTKKASPKARQTEAEVPVE